MPRQATISVLAANEGDRYSGPIARKWGRSQALGLAIRPMPVQFSRLILLAVLRATDPRPGAARWQGIALSRLYMCDKIEASISDPISHEKDLS